ncbi:MAG: hypothetical protein ACJAYU_001326 [Bradymonadia bacterium]
MRRWCRCCQRVKPTALFELNEEPAGDNWVSGGTRIESGTDLSADGVLDLGEVTSTSFVSKGSAGSAGVDGAGGCATGEAPSAIRLWR